LGSIGSKRVARRKMVTVGHPRSHKTNKNVGKNAESVTFRYTFKYQSYGNAEKHICIENGLSFGPVIVFPTMTMQSRDGSVSTALGYGLDDRGSSVRFPVEAGNFSLHHRVQNGSGAHPASYPTGTRDSFPVGKAARA
jgi:hypothetical protein